jgi:hypothetical protein
MKTTTFMLYRAQRNIFQLENTVKRTYCCVAMAKLNRFKLLTATGRSTTVQRECIVAFQWQRWLRECATILRYTYVVYLVYCLD